MGSEMCIRDRNNFQETVKIYKQGKEYYDGLRKVKNLVRDARKVQQTILMGEISRTSMSPTSSVCSAIRILHRKN